jgi:putative transposase
MKDGRNRDKQRRKVAKLHEKAVTQRKDFVHLQSKQIANAYNTVAIENLNMRGMAQGLNQVFP